MTDLHLRDKRPTDATFFYDTRHAGFRTYAEGVFGPWDEARQRASAEKDFGELPIQIIERGGEAIGYLIVERHDDHLFLDEVAVIERARNAGVGTEIVRRVKELAVAANLELRLSVLANNPAQELYERLDFRVTRVEPPRVKMTWNHARAAAPRCSVFIAASLDGYIARDDGGIDWLSLVDRPGEDYGFAAFFASVDTLIVGRATYEKALEFPAWPYAGKQVVVLTRGELEPRHGVRIARGDPKTILTSIDAKHAYIDGGATIAAFLASRAIDSLTVSIIPIVLGGGKRLFPGGEGEHALALASTRAYRSGLVQLRYRLT